MNTITEWKACDRGEDLEAQEAKISEPIPQAVCSDGVPRMDGDTLIVLHNSLPIDIPLPRPKLVAVLYHEEDDDTVSLFRVWSWEEFVSIQRGIKRPDGWENTALLPVEVKYFEERDEREREKAEEDALLRVHVPLEFDIDFSFCQLERVLGEDDEDLQALKERVLERHEELKSSVLAKLHAKAAIGAPQWDANPLFL